MYIATDLGRGAAATADMKARIAALRDSGADVFEALWARHHRAVKLHAGFTYEYALVDREPMSGSQVEEQRAPAGT